MKKKKLVTEVNVSEQNGRDLILFLNLKPNRLRTVTLQVQITAYYYINEVASSPDAKMPQIRTLSFYLSC